MVLKGGTCRDYTEYRVIVAELKLCEEMVGQIKEAISGVEDDDE